MSRNSILTTASAEIGTTENPANTNQTKYGFWYGMNGVPWCAVFVSWVYEKAGNPLNTIDTARGYHYCQSAYNHWKASGEITTAPQPGDIVLFDWTGDGHCDHTGIFVKWIEPGKTFETIEGNTALGDDSNGGIVMRRTRNASLVRAFVASKVLNENALPVNIIHYTKGDRGTAITDAQNLLRQLGYAITVDGEFGIETERELKKFQTEHQLPVTGILTPALMGAMQSEFIKPNVSETKFISGAFLKKGGTGAAVVELQRALNATGANPEVEESGVFDSETFSAVKKFQTKNKLMPDGVAGPKTFSALYKLNQKIKTTNRRPEMNAGMTNGQQSLRVS